MVESNTTRLIKIKNQVHSRWFSGKNSELKSLLFHGLMFKLYIANMFHSQNKFPTPNFKALFECVWVSCNKI
jgi:hypothetical protein